ncbi:helicase HerA domain-containing protein [Ellagibacter isourolithinifaciens]|uniref:helicase HerA domain-containing protein n=1 Tax=Ellagibacter isourolithinifaciens TaxID=2137581 RepID=UPI003A8F5F86
MPRKAATWNPARLVRAWAPTDEEVPAIVDGNGLFQRRVAIVGNTGSGKSDKQYLPGRCGVGYHLARIEERGWHDSRGNDLASCSLCAACQIDASSNLHAGDK